MGDAPLRVMISGAPAAGKGTQCASIVEDVGAGVVNGSGGHFGKGEGRDGSAKISTDVND